MPTLTWESGGARRLPVPIHSPRSLSCLHFLSPVSEIDVHWLQDANCSRPCFGLPDCTWCLRGLANRRCGYAAAQLFDPGREAWSLVIAGLNKTFLTRLYQFPDHVGSTLILQVVRNDRKPADYIVRLPGRQLPPPPTVEPFDVRDHLESFWGLRRRETVSVADPEGDAAPVIPFRRQTAS